MIVGAVRAFFSVCYNRRTILHGAPDTARLRIGEWFVNPTSGEISREGQAARLEVRTMRLLLCLARHPGEVVSIDALLSDAWPGVSVSQDSVYQAVASLRRLLGDDPKDPKYIETVPRLGYRMVATVTPWEDPPALATGRSPAIRRRAAVIWAAGALCLIGVAAFLLVTKATYHRPQPVVRLEPLKSIAVLPFSDLTEEMTAEPFADGITVELINRLSKVPGLRVHAPMSSSALKGKKWTIAGMKFSNAVSLLWATFLESHKCHRAVGVNQVSGRILHRCRKT